MIVEARAKINLVLNVTGRRADGYHDLELIFQPVSLTDRLTIEKKPDPGLAFSCSIKAFENPENLVCRAYKLLWEKYPQAEGLQVHLEKRIPSGAGMGGGSTDAAAFILAADQLFELGMSRQEQIALGVRLGADVPACMLSGAALGRGIGEELKEIATSMEYSLLVIKPPMAFSTAQMYRAIDEAGRIRQKFTSAAVVRALEEQDMEGLCQNLYNIFEEAVPEREKIQEYKKLLLKHGAKASLMTGSGSCVYGIFQDQAMRDQAYEALKAKHEVYACEAVNKGEQNDTANCLGFGRHHPAK